MHVHSLHVSNGGAPKAQIEQVKVTTEGLAGDWQNDRKHHGGPERAVCAYALECIRALQEEGHPIQPGWAAENLVTKGLDWELLAPGATLIVGKGDHTVELQVSAYTTPCRTIAAAFKDGDSSRISQKLHPGFSRIYLRVLKEGTIRTGDPIALK